jgi:glycerol-3-phosphate dehydrogenase (NAD(P)+)
MTDKPVKIAILGAGSWGATLARLFALAGKQICLYTKDESKAAFINEKHQILKPIEVSIPEHVTASNDLEKVLRDAMIVILCCTSQSTRELATNIAAVLKPVPKSERPILVSGVKGLELGTLSRMSEVVAEVIPDIDFCCLSGPNLAGEVLRGLPAAAVIAGKDARIAKKIQAELSISKFRLYTNDDLIGCEFGGTLKNVIAIAAGASDGLQLGSNAKAALLTRGLAEMTRLSINLGAKPLTLAGLAGMGDLLATCAGNASRNYRLGWEFAQGRTLDEISLEIGAVVEGVTTARAVCELSEKLKIDLPIARQVDDALRGKTSPERAIMTLMNRPLASELG